VLDAGIEKDIIELVSRNMKTDHVEEMGRLIFGSFDVYKVLQAPSHVTVPVRNAAGALLEEAKRTDRWRDVVQLLIEIDGSVFMGRQIRLEGLELVLENLARGGLIYDYRRRKLKKSSEDPVHIINWGSLRPGRNYPITIASLDVVESSRLVREHGMRKMRRLMFRFHQFLLDKLRVYEGRLWSWRGDGGIAAFAFSDSERRAVQFCLDVQRTMVVFNSWHEKPFDDDVALRMAVDSGPLTFSDDPGQIVADVINYASHLESKETGAGCVSASEVVYRVLPPTLQRAFSQDGVLEDRSYHTTSRRLDLITTPQD